MMPLHPSVWPMWTLDKGDYSCIGAVIGGHVPGLTPPELRGIAGMIEVAHLGQPTKRGVVGERTIQRRPVLSVFPYLYEFETIDEAQAWVEERRQYLLANGWIEDPIATKTLACCES